MQITKDLIKAEAKNLGFYFCEFAPIQQTPHYEQFKSALKNNCFGNLEFLNSEYVTEGRRDPKKLMASGKTAIVLGINYYQQLSDPLSPLHGVISRYAIFPDYHRVLKLKSRELINTLKSSTGEDFATKIFVDSGPVMEKDFAAMTGAGSIGKNSLFIHPEFGSFLLLCVIFTNLDLDAMPYTETDLCGACNRCREACPTNCIKENRTLKIDECLSYLTVEHEGVVSENLRGMFGNHVFGCDICQDVCPYNLKKQDNVPSFFNMLPELEQTEDIAKLLKMNETKFFEKYKFTVIFKSGFARFLRNVLIAAGNMRDESFLPSIRDHLQANDHIIRSHAIWAFSQYKTGDARTTLKDCLNEEKSPAVITEIRNALTKMD